MKKIILFSLVLLCLLSCVACGAPEATESPSVEPSSASNSAATPKPTPASTPEPTPTVDISKLSITTGLETGGGYQPFVVMIENSAAARPQTGLQQADVVYETMAESSITRFMAVFNDELPVVVGPVRSARIYYINLQREWDPVFIHYGGPSSSKKPSYIYGPESDNIKVRINGVKGNSNDYFWRDKSRKAPHNAYTDLQKILKEKVDYIAEKQTHFLFDASVVPVGQAVSSVQLPYYSKNSKFVEYRYDKEKDKFIRYMDEEPFLSTSVTVNAAGEQDSVTAPVEVQNLIVQYTDIYEFKNDTKGRRNVVVYGEGKAEFFVGGVHQTGTWKRPEGTDLTKFYLEDGSELVIKPGNTWIHIHPDSKEIVVE